MKRWIIFFLALAIVPAWAAITTTLDSLVFRGSSSGTLTMKAPAAAGTNTITWPAGTTNFSATGGANQFLKQGSAGGAITVGALVAGDTPCVSLPAFSGAITTVPGSCVTTASAAPLGTGTSATLVAPKGFYVCTSTCTVNLPVPAAGYEFCILNGDNVSTVITLAALGSSARYQNTAGTAYGTAGTGTLVSTGAAADKVCLLGLDSTHYLTISYTGSWSAS